MSEFWLTIVLDKAMSEFWLTFVLDKAMSEFWLKSYRRTDVRILVDSCTGLSDVHVRMLDEDLTCWSDENVG